MRPVHRSRARLIKTIVRRIYILLEITMFFVYTINARIFLAIVVDGRGVFFSYFIYLSRLNVFLLSLFGSS